MTTTFTEFLTTWHKKSAKFMATLFIMSIIIEKLIQSLIH